ncbi:ribosomal protein S19 binding protein 1 [Columba livia]|uniref:Active regulator of SIRT1 n=1 Tax=Columba livia TaxID=8932 RepID=A0A2I0MJQ6_COLLI|nr:active regulator of SIRT1 [Columba livia]PKK29912.1 ribosomal protein S19 binding protein 1 [Columba livia]
MRAQSVPRIVPRNTAPQHGAPAFPPKRRRSALCACAPGRARRRKVVKSAIEEYHKKKAVNHLSENLQYMLKRRLVADKAITEQVLAQIRGRKSKDQPPKKVAKKKPQGTVFTEEDFRKFEREYFGRP